MDQLNTEEYLITPNTHGSPDCKTRVNIVLLIVYLIIRIPITYFLSVDPSRSHWAFVGIYVAFYLIISALIWINREELYTFHIDRTSLTLFILFGSLFRLRAIDNFITLIFEFLLFLFIIVFSIGLIKGKFQSKPFPVLSKWNGIAIFFGFILAILFIMLDPLIPFDHTQKFPNILIASAFIKNFFIQMSSSAIIEEPIYRGFLWGTLQKLRWSDSKILLFQAFLFWISHITYLNHPFTFWIAAPIFSLVLGYLALKSKSVIPPIITHAIYNASLVAFVAVS